MIKTLIQRISNIMGLKLVKVPRRSFFPNNLGTGDGDVDLPDYSGIDTIIDIGVAGGTPWLYNQFPTQNLILVEPLNVFDTLPDSLKNRSYEIHECAAGAQEGVIEINYDRTRPSLSSVLERTALTKRENHIIEKKSVPVKPLDSIMQESKFSTRKLGLKIDTEGFELEILKGAKQTLKKCAFVVCEASIGKRFENSYDFSELVVFMADQGFTLKKMLRVTVNKDNSVKMADVLFEPV